MRPALSAPASYVPADQARFQAEAPALAPTGTAAERHALRPGAVVFGWLPYWVPASHYQQCDFSLLSHVAYDGYQASETGTLLPPPAGNPTGLAAQIHRVNPACRVLLGVRYQEPANGAALFGAVGTASQAALVQAVVQQVRTLGANGVSLDLSLRTGPASAPEPPIGPAHKASNAELARDRKNLDKTRNALNATKKRLTQDSLALLSSQQQMTEKLAKSQPVTSSERFVYDRLLRRQRQQAADYRHDLTAFRKAMDANKHHMSLPDAPAATPSTAAMDRPAMLRRFVVTLAGALRRQAPTAILALSLPATDSAGIYTKLGDLDGTVSIFIVKAFDYSEGQLGEPGPLAPLSAIATSVRYYQGQGVPAGRLVVGLAQVGKLWPRYANPPLEPGAVAPYLYLTSRTAGTLQPSSQQPDTASGSTQISLPFQADLAPAGAPAVPLLAWVDDSASFATKFDWILSQKLGGVGLWALGFDAPDAPVWDMLEARWAAPASPPIAVAEQPADTVASTIPVAPADSVDTANEVLGEVVNQAQHWISLDPLAQVLLFALMLLLGSAWLGLLLGTVVQARHLLPFPSKLRRVLIPLIVGALLQALYVSLFGHFNRQTLLATWLLALVALVALVVVLRRQRRPAQLP